MISIWIFGVIELNIDGLILASGDENRNLISHAISYCFSLTSYSCGTGDLVLAFWWTIRILKSVKNNLSMNLESLRWILMVLFPLLAVRIVIYYAINYFFSCFILVWNWISNSSSPKILLSSRIDRVWFL